MVQPILAVGNEVPRPRGAVLGIPATSNAVGIQAVPGRIAIEIARMRWIGAVIPTPLEEGRDLGLALVRCATIHVALFADRRYVQLTTLEASGRIRGLRHIATVMQAPHQEPVDEPATAFSRLVPAALGVAALIDARRNIAVAAVEAASELVASPVDATLRARIGAVRTVAGALPQDVSCPAPALLELPPSVETLRERMASQVLATMDAAAARSMIAVITALLEEGLRSLRAVLGLATALEAGLLVVVGPPLAAVQASRMIRRLRMRMIMGLKMIRGMWMIVGMIAGQAAVTHRDGGLFLALRGNRAVVARAPREDLFPEPGATVPTVRRVANLAMAAAPSQKVASFPLALLRIGVGHEASLEELPRRVRTSCATAGRRLVIAMLEAGLEVLFSSCPAFVRVPAVHDALVVKPLRAVLATLLAGRPIARRQTLFVGGRRSSFTLSELRVRGIVAQFGHAPLIKLHRAALAALRAGAWRRGFTALQAVTEELMTPRLATFVVVGVSRLTLLYKGPGFAHANLLAAGGRFPVAIVETHPQLLLENGVALILGATPLETLVLGFGGGSQAAVAAVVGGRAVTFIGEAVCQRFLRPGLAIVPTGLKALRENPGGLPLALFLAGQRRPAILETAPESFFGSGLALGGVRRSGSAVKAHGEAVFQDLLGVQPATSFAVRPGGLHVAASLTELGRDGLTIFPSAPGQALRENLRLHHVAARRVDRDTVSPNTTHTQRGDKD